MTSFAEIEDSVTEYIRDYIRAQRLRGRSYKAIGAQLGVSHVWVQQILNVERYGRRVAGPELEHRVAELLHGGSIDALRRAALHFAGGGLVIVEDNGQPVAIAPDPPPSTPGSSQDSAEGRKPTRAHR